MDNINDIIASLTPDDIEALKKTAESVFGTSGSGNSQADFNFNPNKGNDNPSPFGMDFGSMLDPEMFSKIGKIMSAMNSDEGKRCRLIEALTPNLSCERQRKADEAIQILKLLEILPMITDLTSKGD